MIDLETNRICYANAGHPKPMLVRRSLDAVELLENQNGRSNPALGLFEGSIYPTSQASLSPNDLIMLYTDGLYDVEGKFEELFGPEWLLDEVRQRQHLPVGVMFDELLQDVRIASGSGDFADDVCLVGVELAERRGGK